MSARCFVVAAACRVQGQVFTAPCHLFAFQKAIEAGLAREDDFLYGWHDEGFVTNTGEWLDRQQSYQLALANQQLTPCIEHVERNRQLVSEELRKGFTT